MFRSWTVLTAGVVAFAIAGIAKADGDLVRLDGKGDAEVQETRGYYGGGGWGRGYYGGGFGRSYYGGGWGRGYYGGGWGRGYYGGGWGRSYYGGYYGGYRPYWGGVGIGIGLGYNSYYGGWSAPSYYYSTPTYSYYTSPCSTDGVGFPTTTLNLGQPMTIQQAPVESNYPYNGEPQNVVPPATVAPAPMQYPNRPLLPRDGKLVSMPGDPYEFRAFGEESVEPVRVAPNATETLRVSYPAYGEPMPTFSAGSTVYRTALR